MPLSSLGNLQNPSLGTGVVLALLLAQDKQTALDLAHYRFTCQLAAYPKLLLVPNREGNADLTQKPELSHVPEWGCLVGTLVPDSPCVCI